MKNLQGPPPRVDRVPAKRAARGRALAGAALALVVACVELSSCAYYNTYYYARKYYYQATGGQPYLVEKPQIGHPQEFNKSIDYSKKLIAQYPKHKLVDDAYLLWARALLGNDDPRLTIKMLEEFPTLYPKSSLRDEAKFYLGVAYRQSRKNRDALRSLDEFLAESPKHDLAQYAHLERSRVLMALDRPEEAAAAAGVVLEKFPSSKLVVPARIARAEARFAQHAYDLAREDFHELGALSRDDDERLTYLLREVDCLEAAHMYDAELSRLRNALSHEQAPIAADSTGARAFAVTMTPTNQRYGRLLTRLGTAFLAQGNVDDALRAYRSVVRDFSHTDQAAEAQYRIGYAYETAADDFDKARIEYSRVKDQSGSSAFVNHAADRLVNLDRLTQFRSAGGDSLQKKAEAGFLLAELYLFQLDKPERALEEYEKVSQEFSGTPMGGKALNAQAWVLSRKFKRDAEADSLFWLVVHDYPATEAQLAARDYLEFAGSAVPESLIKMPEPPPPPPVDTTRLTPPPQEQVPLGTPPGEAPPDSNLQIHPPGVTPQSSLPRFQGPVPHPAGGAPTGAAAAAGAAAVGLPLMHVPARDSSAAAHDSTAVPRDTTAAAPGGVTGGAPSDSIADAPSDSTGGAPPDSIGGAPRDSNPDAPRDSSGGAPPDSTGSSESAIVPAPSDSRMGRR